MRRDWNHLLRLAHGEVKFWFRPRHMASWEAHPPVADPRHSASIRRMNLPSRFLLLIARLPGTTFAAGLTLVSMTQPAPAATATTPVELIERAAFFGNPTRAQARLSPDGKWLSWLAPRDGVLNIWVAPIDSLDAAKPLTSEKKRPIREHYWSQNSRLVLFINDAGGDENFLLYGVDVASGALRNFTPFQKTRAAIVGTSTSKPDEILVGLNNRNPQFHDIHRLNVTTGELTLVLENNAWAGFVPDDTLRLRLAQRQTPAGGFEVFELSADHKPAAQPLLAVAPEDSLTTNVLTYTTDGSLLYVLDSRGRDTSALVALDQKGGPSRPIAQSGQADVGDVLLHPRTRVAQAYRVNYLKPEWFAIDPALKPDLDFLQRELKGDVQITSRTTDDRLWTVAVDPVIAPAAFHLYDRAAKKLTRLFVMRPELEGKPLAPMHPVEIKTRDGLTLTAFLSLPLGADANGDARPEQPLPMVLNVHGGPWARDSYGFHPEHQWMANRGYAVLSVNYRGSSGLGKKFLNAANGEFAGKMHHDLIDAVNWAVAEKIAPAERIAIYGGSYGGYATLVGLTFTPDVFACGVDIVGPSSLVTLIESFPAYWAPFLEATWYKRVGDPRTKEGREDLLARSPISRVTAIKKPLLIAQGANDPRVTQKESDQLVAIMKQKQIPVTYALYSDEGHGFARPQNRTSFYAVTEAFLAKHLGGRFQPAGNDFDGSSLVVPEGADNVPGLPEALAAKPPAP